MEYKTGARDDVLEFYRKLPFNAMDNPQNSAALIKRQNSFEYIYPDPADFKENIEVLEMGCGAGWLINHVALYYNCNITGVDFNQVALDMAKETADELNVSVDLVCSDLFRYECEPKDIVISIGVLHHTSDCMGGLRHCISLTKPGGIIFIGLYHKYGRKPFLDYFADLKKENPDEKFLFEKYRELDARFSDDTQARSWFLDQVLHPYETQHTLEEIISVFQEMNVELISTSINYFKPFSDIEELFEEEKKMYEKGLDFLQAGKYYPGFFYVKGKVK